MVRSLRGQSKIQKFFKGTDAAVGKSTFFRILNMLFEDYVGTFQAKALGQAQNRFASNSQVESAVGDRR